MVEAFTLKVHAGVIETMLEPNCACHAKITCLDETFFKMNIILRSKI